MPSVASDFDIFPPRPAQSRQAASQKRDEPSRFDSLVDEAEPKARADRTEASQAQESREPASEGAQADSAAAPVEPTADPAESAQTGITATADSDAAQAVAAPSPETMFLAAMLEAMAPADPDAETPEAETPETASADTDQPETAPVQAAMPQVTVQALAAATIPLMATDDVPVATTELTGEADGEAAKQAPAIPDPLAALAQAAPKNGATSGKDAAETADADANAASGRSEGTDASEGENETGRPMHRLTGAEGGASETEAEIEAPAAKPQQAAAERPEARPASDNSVQPQAKSEQAGQPQVQAPVIHHAAAAADIQAVSRPAEQAVPVAGIAVEIAAQARAGKNRFEIRLDPPELGRIDVRLDIDRDGKVTSRLIVDRVETLDILRRDAHSLERALNDAGLKTSDSVLQFSLRDQGFAQRDPSGQEADKTARLIASDAELPATATAHAYPRLPGLGGGLDIRV